MTTVSPPPSTARQVLRGSVIMVGARWAVRLIGLISTLILARLLTPADFGVVAIAMLVIGFIEAVAERGQSLALIRLREPCRAHFDTAWTLQILVGLVLSVVIALSAPAVAAVLDDARLMPVILVLSLRSLINGFINVGMATNRITLRFERDFLFLCSQKLVSFAVCVGLAVVLRSYWALAAAMVADRVAAVLLSYAWHPYRPRWSLARLAEIWPFSAWMLAADLGDFLARQADAMAIAVTAPGTELLGHYRVAGDVATMPTYALSLPVAYASFPVYARLNPEALRLASLQGLAVMLALAVPAGVGLACVADDAVAVVLGAQWTAAAPYVPWLALAGILMALRINVTTVVTVSGRSRLAALLGWADVAVLGCGLALVLSSGDPVHIAQIRLAVLAAMMPATLAAYRAATGAGWSEIAATLWRPVTAAALMAGAVTAVHGVAVDGAAARLATDMVTGLITYGVATVLLWDLAGRPAGLESGVLQRLRLGKEGAR